MMNREQTVAAIEAAVIECDDTLKKNHQDKLAADKAARQVRDGKLKKLKAYRDVLDAGVTPPEETDGA